MQQPPVVLIVEDDSFLRKAYQQSFGKTGFTVTLVNDGDEALQAIEQAIPDIVILDLVMPRMNGMEVLRKLRASEKFAHIKVIVATNVSSDDDEKECIKLGVAAYLVKTNYSVNDIVSMTQQALAGK